jgi:hypothetical protein
MKSGTQQASPAEDSSSSVAAFNLSRNRAEGNCDAGANETGEQQVKETDATDREGGSATKTRGSERPLRGSEHTIRTAQEGRAITVGHLGEGFLLHGHPILLRMSWRAVRPPEGSTGPQVVIKKEKLALEHVPHKSQSQAARDVKTAEHERGVARGPVVMPREMCCMVLHVAGDGIAVVPSATFLAFWRQHMAQRRTAWQANASLPSSSDDAEADGQASKSDIGDHCGKVQIAAQDGQGQDSGDKQERKGHRDEKQPNRKHSLKCCRHSAVQ